MSSRLRASAFVSAAFILTGCASMGAMPEHLMGVWGGPHSGVEFQGGLADVQFDCGAGTIDDVIFPAADGAFSVKGTYRTGAPGPIKVGQIFRSQGAVYAGHVTKPTAKGAPKTMTLDVALEDGTNLGPFALTEGVPPQLTRCL